MIDFLIHQIHGNQFLSGGLVMGIVAAVWAQCRAWPTRIYHFVWRRCFIEVDIPDREEAFRWLDTWLSQQTYSKTRARSLTVKTSVGLDFLVFHPSVGSHWFFYQKRLVHLMRNRKDQAQNMSFGLQESFTLRVYTRSRELVYQLLRDAVKAAAPARGDTVAVNAYQWDNWNLMSSVRRRPLDSVVLPDGIMEKLVAEISKFRDRRDWYVARGIPWRFGVLLTGAPGGGKTSTILALASYFQLSLNSINLKSTGDGSLLRAVSMLDSDAAVFMEDVDCLFEGRESTSKDNEKCATFSGLLNAIDGVASGEGRVLFLTTNHPEKLDPALIRPGRVDLRVDLGAPEPEQKSRLFDRFFPSRSEEEAAAFAGDSSLDSMAKAQQRLLEMVGGLD